MQKGHAVIMVPFSKAISKETAEAFWLTEAGGQAYSSQQRRWARAGGGCVGSMTTGTLVSRRRTDTAVRLHLRHKGHSYNGPATSRPQLPALPVEGAPSGPPRDSVAS